MIIIGIDPGSRVTGFGVLKISNKMCYYVKSGSIRLTQKSDPCRLKYLQTCMDKVIRTYNPNEAVVEEIFVSHNSKSALKLAQARGVILCSLASCELPIYEYSAKQIKQALVGTGAANKAQVQYMVKSFLCLSKEPQMDASDALATAICHFHTSYTIKSIPSTAVSKVKRGRLR